MLNKLAILASLLATAAGALAAHLYLAHLEEQVLGGEPTQILIATQDVPAGSVLSQELVGVRDVPKVFVESRNIRASDAKQVLGIRVSVALKANEAILLSDLVRYDGSNWDLAALVPEGMRAVALDVRGADFYGLLRPGNRVDLLFSDTSSGGAGSTVTLLQNLLVLAVGSEVSADTPARASTPGSVTLSVGVEEVQVITEARRHGQLALALRNSDDIVIVEKLPATTAADVLTAGERVVRLSRSSKKPDIEHVR